MSSTATWDSRRGRILTRKGGWRIGHGIRVGPYSLLDDLVGRHTFFELLFLEVTDRLPAPELARWIEGCFMCLSFPDPRIWCNQIGALGGSARCSPVAAVAAGVTASDSSLYGPGAALRACEFIADALAQERGGASVEAIVAGCTARGGRLRAPGYSRPIARGDDRVDALVRLASGLGFADGPHLDLGWRIDALLRTQGGNSLNMLGYVAAFVLDNGITRDEAYRLFTLCVNAGVQACYAEAAGEPAGSFLPLQRDDIEYTGAPPRELPAGGCA